MLQKIDEVGNPQEYIDTIISTDLTQTQLEIAISEEEILNILRHVPYIWNYIFFKMVQEQGIEGMVTASNVGEQMNDILENKAVVQFVQILLILFFTMESSSLPEEEAGDSS